MADSGTLLVTWTEVGDTIKDFRERYWKENDIVGPRSTQ